MKVSDVNVSQQSSLCSCCFEANAQSSLQAVFKMETRANISPKSMCSNIAF